MPTRYKLDLLDPVGDARRYLLTMNDGTEHHIVISNAQMAVSGGVLAPLRDAIDRILQAKP